MEGVNTGKALRKYLTHSEYSLNASPRYFLFVSPSCVFVDSYFPWGKEVQGEI